MIFIYIIFVIITTIYHCKSQQLTMATQTHISGDSEFEDILTQSIPLPILFASSNTPELYVNNLTQIPIEINYLRFIDINIDTTKYIPNDPEEIIISGDEDTVFNLKQSKFNDKKRPYILHIKGNVKLSSELKLILSKGNITKVKFIDMSTLTDEDFENIFSVKQPNLTHICIENCPQITSIPDNAYTGSPLLTRLEIKECDSFDKISSLVSLTILNTLIISGFMFNRVFLPDNLWHLNETLQYLEVPNNTHFHQILVNSLKKYLLPDRYKPDVVRARNTLIRDYNNTEKAQYKIFLKAQQQLKQIFYDNLRLRNIKINKECEKTHNIEKREHTRIFRREQDIQRSAFMLSVEYKAETIARLKEEKRKSVYDDAEVVE